MKKKLFKLLNVLYLLGAFISLFFCIWDAIMNGLFASATDITGGIGVAMVLTVLLLAQSILFLLTALNLKKLNKLAFQQSFILFAVSVVALIFAWIGNYFIIAPLIGILLPIGLLYCMKMK